MEEEINRADNAVNYEILIRDVDTTFTVQVKGSHFAYQEIQTDNLRELYLEVYYGKDIVFSGRIGDCIYIRQVSSR